MPEKPSLGALSKAERIPEERRLPIDIRGDTDYHFSILSNLPAPPGCGLPSQGERLMKKFVCMVFLAAVVVLTGRLSADDKEKGKPKYNIEAIMVKAHKGGEESLRNKVLAGKASKKELEQLVELYVELGKNTPPKGSKESWKKKTDAVIAAVKKVKADPESKAALTTLGNATKCAACHDEHRKDE